MIVIAVLVVLVGSIVGLITEHIHGQGQIPDWYDSDCCHDLDCRPVSDDNDIEFGTNKLGDYARYKPTGNMFYKSQFRKSQDERYHVCIHPNGRSLCVYIRQGV